MMFSSRQQAGTKLAEYLKPYRYEKAVVYALPRGGVVLGAQVASTLNLSLDLLIPRKVGHPDSPEYAIAAVTETQIARNEEEVSKVDQKWFADEVAKQRAEAKRRRIMYLGRNRPVEVEGKTAIVVDDGLATGLTMKAALMELRKRKPSKIVVAVPVAPIETAAELGNLADEVHVLYFPPGFFGSIGSYYEEFPQLTDEEVVNLIKVKTP